ncbi:hypothetical protein [Hyphococcus luteus]|nr:hypothetical protein [Marinicaulis flavus]
MISSLAAALFLFGANGEPQKSVMCVQSKHGDENYIIFAIPRKRLEEFSDRTIEKERDFTIVSCPGKWDASATAALCNAVEKFSDDLKAAMTEVYAISPDEMCEASREATAPRE